MFFQWYFTDIFTQIYFYWYLQIYFYWKIYFIVFLFYRKHILLSFAWALKTDIIVVPSHFIIIKMLLRAEKIFLWISIISVLSLRPSVHVSVVCLSVWRLLYWYLRKSTMNCVYFCLNLGYHNSSKVTWADFPIKF